MPMVPEHPVMGAAVGLPAPESEASGMAAPAGELPDLLSPAEVATAMSEPVRVASAPDVEMDDGQGSADEPSAPEPVAAEPMPAETVEVTEPVVVETVAPQVVEASKQVSVEPEAPETVEVQKSSGGGVPRVEFEAPDGTWVVETTIRAEDMPVEAELTAAPDARQAGLPQTAAEHTEPVLVPGTLRGVMGYRLPLVSRQALPDQVVSGVLIPAHTTYVILQPGYWELVGLSPHEVEFLRDADANGKADKPAAQSEPVPRRWNPLNLFRKR